MTHFEPFSFSLGLLAGGAVAACLTSRSTGAYCIILLSGLANLLSGLGGVIVPLEALPTLHHCLLLIGVSDIVFALWI
jgi:hypothetical protein